MQSFSEGLASPLRDIRHALVLQYAAAASGHATAQSVDFSIQGEPFAKVSTRR